MKPAAARLDVPFFAVNALVSAAALGLIAYLLLAHHGASSLDVSAMPAVDASLNGLAALCLVLGRVAISRRSERAHRAFMLSALAASAAFFLCYTGYHYVHGDTHYVGTSGMRLFYLSVLATHVLLSMLVVPLVLTALFFAFTQQRARHRRVARVLFPLWLYVSATGVAIFFLLRGHAG